jgi:hypothetical protein
MMGAREVNIMERIMMSIPFLTVSIVLVQTSNNRDSRGELKVLSLLVSVSCTYFSYYEPEVV